MAQTAAMVYANDRLNNAKEACASHFVDQRVNKRRKSRFRATMVHGAHHATLSCLVVDISETGARIRTDSADDLPVNFYVICHAERSAMAVEMIWRSASEIGVRLKSKSSLEGKLTSELAAVYQAWGE